MDRGGRGRTNSVAYLAGLGIATAAVIAASTYYIYKRSRSEASRIDYKIHLLSKA